MLCCLYSRFRKLLYNNEVCSKARRENYSKETCVSRHHESRIKDTPETPVTSQQYGKEWYKGVPQLCLHYAQRSEYLGHPK